MHTIKKYNKGVVVETKDVLTIEEILNISINHEPYTITMRTPLHEQDLVRGILLTEQVYVENENPIFEIIQQNEKQFVTHINVTIPIEKIGKGFLQKRNLLSVTSCGMCGKQEEKLQLQGEKLVSNIIFLPTDILHFFEVMQQHQKNFEQTGGTHAAAIFDAEKNMLICYEDIGRHNAVDKTIGYLLNNNLLQKATCIIVSGRVSYEIVNKCYQAKIPYLAAVSAPSSMAVEMCHNLGIHLFGFCRKDTCNEYS